MCLLVLAWQTHPRWPLLVAANRDEFHERPTAGLHVWPDHPRILAGRDLRADGTWLGVDRLRRFGAITNFRGSAAPAAGAPSRGGLIPAFFEQSLPPGEFLAQLEARSARYAGFSLLLADGQSLWYASNQMRPFARELTPGVYGLSNHLLDTPWPKLERVRRRFGGLVADTDAPTPGTFFPILEDRVPPAPDEPVPEAGPSHEWSRLLATPFVTHPDYGTRSSTVVLLARSGALRMTERRFDRKGDLDAENEFALNAGEWPGTAGRARDSE